MKYSVVYIAGLSHSGTTLLNLMLGQHSRLIGLGEAFGLLGTGYQRVRRDKEVCSCGKTIDDCIFWKKVVDRLETHPEYTQQQQYELLFEAVRNQYRNDKIVVDASKKIGPLNLLRTNEKVDLKVIHIVKDVRAFTVSQIDKPKTRIIEGLPNPLKEQNSSYLRGLYDQSPFTIFLRWHKQNRRIKEYLQKFQIRSIQIGYDELVLYPELMIKKICEFLGVQPEPSMLSLGVVSSHVIHGNRIRHKPEKRRIMYDNRWFHRREWILPSLVFRNVIRFNAREVYSNTGKPSGS